MEPLDPQRFREPPYLTGPEVADRAGMSHEYAMRILRAVGFPEVPDDAVEFGDNDVEVLTALNAILSQGYDPEEILTIARTYGYGLSRMADAEVRLFRKTLIDPARAEGITGDELGARLTNVIPPLLDMLGRVIDHVHRRHLVAALQQSAPEGVEGDAGSVGVGFVDLVGFSRLVRDLDEAELGRLVTRFENLAIEQAVGHGSRLVKMIGDGALFVSSDPGSALETALGMVGEADIDGLPPARGGVDFGEAVALGGDYFGPPVNVAARLSAFAKAGTVVATAAVMDSLPGPAEASRIPRVRLKGVGQVRAFKVDRYPAG